MDGLLIGFWLIMLACLIGSVWKNVTQPNLHCRWLGHGIRIEQGWAYCTRCGWRELLPAVDD
jgi:hypothetical protein